jgi:hypothetical protein
MTTTAARILADSIRDWAEMNDMPERAPVEMAQQLGLQAYKDGATVQQAAARAQSYLRSWSLHPANVVIDRERRIHAVA